MNFKSLINSCLSKTGYQVIKLNPMRDPAMHRARLIASNQVDLVIDVGASKGQYGTELRKYGYAGRIVSVEPIAAAFRELSTKSGNDPDWTVLNIALGDQPGDMLINVAENSFSSSVLEILPTTIEAIPRTRFIRQEKIFVSTLDMIFSDIVGDAKNIYLKMDVQGYEKKVLEGAAAALGRIDLIQLEMSLAPLYRDELCFPELHAFMRELGYTLVSIEPTLIYPDTGEMLQIDGIYRRSAASIN